MHAGHATGIWLVDKPVGLTSRDVVDMVSQKLRRRDLGHTGTLDPQASGLLILLGGQARKLQNFFTTLAKRYEARIELGASSDTDDSEGAITPCQPAAIPVRQKLEQTLAAYLGTISQKPPAYSAIKLRGRRAYDLARQGECVELTPRQVEIYEIEIHHYAYPCLALTVRCSAGTYIRALARDIGYDLHTGGYLQALRRLAIGEFTVANAFTPDTTEASSALSLETALAPYPRVDIAGVSYTRFCHGQSVTLPAEQAEEKDGDVFVWAEGQVIAWGKRRAGLLCPYRLCRTDGHADSNDE
jgi:tRNA pseudouridine55 synthase